MRKQFKRLVMLSGGIDSTVALLMMARQFPNKDILVHHVHMINKEGRANCELKASRDVVKWIKQHTKTHIHYQESTFDYGTIPHLIQDIEVIGFITGILLRSSRYAVESITINASKYDLSRPGYELRANSRFNIIATTARRNDIKYDYPIKHMERKEVIEYLPKDLLALTHFCRKPFQAINGSNVCGRCKTCQQTLPYL